MKYRLAALVACLTLTLAACGGSAPKPAHRAPTRVQVTADAQIRHPNRGCRPSDFAQPCKYPIPLASADIFSTAAPGTGIDFTLWDGCQDPQGYAFAASYLSYDSAKNWTRDCLNRWHAAGRATVAVWETSANRAQAGCGAGASDAREASQQLAALGAPIGQPFDMAIDYDSPGWDVADYFRCASNAEPGRVNAYGGETPILYLYQHGLVGHLNWMAYAWQYGRPWLPASIAPLEQFQNGSVVDWDRAIAPDYGQWPRPQPPVDPYRIFPKQRFDLPYGQKASEYNTVKLYEAAGCQRLPRGWIRQVCKSSGWHERLLRDRIVWVAHHKRVVVQHPAGFGVGSRVVWVPLKKADWARDRLGQRLHRIEYDLTH